MKKLLLAIPLLISCSAFAQDTIKIGLVTALSGQSARAGEAITRGLQVAIDELNAKGGVLGKKFELVRRDDEATPAMGPWAAGTPITKNGAKDNYVFRVSAVDEIVDKAMLQYSQRTFNAKNCGMILVNNPWGESNEKGLTAALNAKGMKPAGIEKFEGNDVDVVPQLSRLKAAGADCLFLVGNVGPSAQVVKSLDRMGWKPPIVSHWGPAGGRFTELAGPSAPSVHFVQTYSFFGNQGPVGQKVLKALMAKYPDIKGPGDVTPAVGVANAYDAMMLTALAIQNAGSTQGPKVREGYYKIGRYEGLIKTYDKPFTTDNHDAVNENDYVSTQFIDNQILPVGMKK